MSIGKEEIIAKLADATNVSKAAAKANLEAALEVISAELEAGNDVTLMGFGKFAVKQRASREGRNPQTGAPIQIGESVSAGWKISPKLKARLNR